MSTGYVALMAGILGVVGKWRAARKEERRITKAAEQMKLDLAGITRAKLNEQAVADLNADLNEYHATGIVPYDSTIAKHIQGRNPTTRIVIKPKPEKAEANRQGARP